MVESSSTQRSTAQSMQTKTDGNGFQMIQAPITAHHQSLTNQKQSSFIAKDYLGLKQQPKIMVLFETETLLFSDKIKKINMFDWVQERMFVVTTDKVYNIKKNKIKRKIPISKISGVSKTVQPGRGEFTIHVPSEYDYRFFTDKREEIIDVLKARYMEKLQLNLPIFGIERPNLKEFTTTERDAKRGQNRFPPQQFRIKAEDLMRESETHLGKQEIIDNNFTVLDDQKQIENVQLRNMQFQESKNFETNEDDDEEADDYDTPSPDANAKVSMRAGGNLIFTKKQEIVKLQDFQIKKMVGKGTFGKVYLVQNIHTQKIYAMKCIRKDVIIDNEQFDNIKLEKDILYNVEHPFIVGMDYVFQNDFRIYFIMNFIKGGELFRHLVKVKRFNEEQARFFIVQIAIALGHLHTKSILYRDLKPENILFGEDGYLFLADFGLAKLVTKNELANSFCGTAEYLAPEMLIGSGHDHTVDWWALGILLYEMLVGIPPFFHRNKHRMYFLIKESQVNFPDPVKHGIEVSPHAICII